MTTPLVPEAVRCYRMLTELSLMLSVIDWETYEERLQYLDELLGDPGNGAQGANGDPDGDAGDAREEPRGAAPEGGGAVAHPELIGRGEPPPDWLQFIPGGAIGHLRRWHFHKYDPDPHPSVPHGHDEGKPFPKLDSYLGWIYASTTNKNGRLSKNDTRALWNDQRFRDFSTAALVHFAQGNPRYVWRVDYPMRLPRRR
jgi:hypothetical protein